MNGALRALRSVRARTTLAATLLVAVALVVGSLLLVRALGHSLSTATDTQSRARVSELLSQAREGTLPRIVDGIGDDSLAQVVIGDVVVATSDNLVGKPPVRASSTVGEELGVVTMRAPDDEETEDYRIWSARTRTADGRDVTAFVGPSLESVQEATHSLTLSLVLGVPLLTALLALGTWLTVGRALRPVEQVRREVAALSARSLHRRVPVPPTHDEVERLARTMNELLDRLESADRRQREFVGNASHDLQSPLTVFRTELEVSLTRGEQTQWQHTAHQLLLETDRMESLVSDLLFLAQVEDDRRPQYDALDLEDLVAEEVARFPCEGPVQVRLQATPAPVRGVRRELGRMVRNLLQNAAEFAGEHIAVSVGEEAGQVTLTVEDDGPGVPEQHRDEVFERFFTSDPSRDRREAGTGLGLAIARSVVESHGGTIRLEGDSPTSRFVVRLPAL